MRISIVIPAYTRTSRDIRVSTYPWGQDSRCTCFRDMIAYMKYGFDNILSYGMISYVRYMHAWYHTYLKSYLMVSWYHIPCWDHAYDFNNMISYIMKSWHDFIYVIWIWYHNFTWCDSICYICIICKSDPSSYYIVYHIVQYCTILCNIWLYCAISISIVRYSHHDA